MGQLLNNCRQIARDAATPELLLPALSSGLMVGLLVIVVELSMASLIFSGQLSPFASSAAGLTLFGTFVMCVVLALGSSYSNSICLPEDAPAAIMAGVSASVAAALCTPDADPRVAFATLGAALTLSTLSTAALFALLGRFGLGNMVRYMPYPVVGGFLAGVGWMLVDGSFSIMNGMPLSFATLPALSGLEQIARWAPGLLLALALLWSMERWRSAGRMPKPAPPPSLPSHGESGPRGQAEGCHSRLVAKVLTPAAGAVAGQGPATSDHWRACRAAR